MYKEQDYKDAINFALNYPPSFKMLDYDNEKDICNVDVFDYGWYNINLNGSFVRSCLHWKGKKKWTQ